MFLGPDVPALGMGKSEVETCLVNLYIYIASSSRKLHKVLIASQPEYNWEL